MPRYNTTVEDYAPILIYSPDWTAGTSSDPLTDLYSDSSFTLTQTDGGTASFEFNGTSFTIFGSKRGNHGVYQVTIDGNSFAPESGASPDPGQFQVPLFSSPPLVQGLHTVTLTNQGNTFVDIDFITWENSIGTADEQLVVNTVQDTDPAFTYTPPNSWGTNPPSIGTYSGSSGHGTATPGAFMTYTFEGDGVSLYGPVGPAGSPFSVSVDGGNPVIGLTANKQFFQPQVLLYAATNLGGGQHTVKVTYEPTQPGQIFAIDFANVYTTPSLTPGSNRASTAGTATTQSATNGLSGGAIAGIVIALLFILFVLAGLLFFLRRRKSRKNRRSLEAPMIQSLSNRDIIAAPGTYPTQPSVRRYPSSADGSYFSSGGARTLALETQSQAYVPSAASESEYSPTSHYGVALAESSSQQHGVAHAESSVSSSRQYHNADPMKGQPLPLPPTASQSLAHIPAAQLRANRRVVPGRSQDFGPAPPDYVQATERFGNAI